MKRDDSKKNKPEDGDLAAEELREIAQTIATEFPPPRLGTELVLLEIDPTRVHAYWNIDLDDFEDAKLDAGSPDCPLVLRMYDVTGIQFNGTNAHDVFDNEVQGLQGHWYFDLFRNGRTYLAEIGFRRSDSSLAFLARSNEVHTPPAEQSAHYDTTALNVADLDEGPLVTDLKSEAVSKNGDETLAGAGDILSDDYPKIPEGAELALERRTPELAVIPAEEKPEASLPPEPPQVGPWPDAKEIEGEIPGFKDRVKEFYRKTATGPSAITDAEELMREEVKSEGATLPAPERIPDSPAPVEDAAPQAAKPAELGSYVNLSSFEHARQQVELEVNTELHVFGRAKPGSNLVLFGQKVQLRPDGTFSIRKPLPNGAVVLPLLFSTDGEEK